MTKKKRYVPGWQQKQIAKDRETMQKAALVLDSYYSAQKLKDALDEQEDVVKSAVQEPVTPEQQNNTREESERKDAEVIQDTIQLSPAQQQKAQRLALLEQYNQAYSTESPDSYLSRTSDPTAFSDLFIPSVLDPKYNEWAKRLAARASKKDPNNQSVADKTAIAAVNLQESLKKDRETGKELATERMNRRIRENDTFGKINKNRALTNDEIKEIHDYRLLTDPLFFQQRMKQLDEEIKELQKLDELENIEEPENYFGDSVQFGVGMGGTMNLGAKLLGLARSAWSKSFFSDFMEETNNSQFKTAVGQIQRSKELADMSNNTSGYMDLIEEYANNLAQLHRFNTKNYQAFAGDEGRNKVIGGGSLQGLSPEERNIYGNILERNRIIREQLGKLEWWKNANNLASWAPSGIMGKIAGAVDSVIDDDLGGVRNGLYGLDGKLDNLNKLMSSRTNDEKWLNAITDQIGQIKSQLNSFNANVAEKQERWRQLSLTDAQDIVDWRTGNNWLGIHTEVDPYYKSQKHLLEQSEFDWSDPVKMAQFGWSGIAGGSNSSWWKSILGTTSKIGGAIGGAITTGGTSAAILVGAIAASFEADKSAGSDENNIEANEKTSSALRSKLVSSEKYNAFLEEGLKQLQDMSVRKDPIWRHTESVIKDLVKSSKDKDKLNDFIIDTFLMGLWHSKDPEITKIHADAVIGTNNQFYNNQPVNTADAAVGSIVDIANLEPVKYLSRSVKIAGKLQARALRNTPVGLAYNGFKEGVHNVANRVADSQIAQLAKEGIIKTAEGASKIPLGAVIGSVAGANAGLYASDGSVYGALGGAAVGATTGVLLHKAPKFIGIEDKIAKGYLATRAFATRVPSAWMGASAIAKPIANISTRLGLDTASEMLQEGVQALNQRETSYDPQHNRPIVNRLFDDLMLASHAAYIWLNQNDPEMKGESEVYSQMNATPLLTIFGPGIAQVGVQIKGGIKDFNMATAVANNIDAARRGNIAELEQAKSYAMHTSKEDREEMKKKFQQFRNIAGTHEDAIRRMNPSVSIESLMEQYDHFIPNELIDQLEQDYEDIYTLANSPMARVIGARMHAKPGSENYAKIVSMLSFRKKHRTEAFDKLKQKDSEIDQILGLDFLDEYIEAAEVEDLYNDSMFYGEGLMNTNLRKDIKTKNDVAKMLVKAATLMEIVEDYTTAHQMKGDDINSSNDVFLNRSKARLTQYKKQLKENGFDVETVDDVVNTLNISEEGAILQSLISRSIPEELRPTLSMEDYVHTYMSLLRERELLEFDFLIQDQLLRDFEQNPEYQINKWDSRLKSDRQLEAILEEDYVNTIRDYESAAAREVKDGDIYVGDDGYWYITKKVGDNFEKHRYHPNSRKIDPEALAFNPIEYDQAKKSEEESLLKRNASKKANENIQNGTTVEQNQEKKPTEQLEEQLIEPEVEPSIEPEQPIQQPESQEIKKGDFVNTGTEVAQVLGTNEDGDFILSYGAGLPVAIYPASLTLTKVTSPIKSAKYSTGEIIKANNGEIYTVGNVYLESIDKDTYEPTYSYDLINVDTYETLPSLTDSLIDAMTTIAPETTTGSTVEPNEKQNEVMLQLADKLASDKRNTELSNGQKRRTGHDYFVKIKLKIERFIRVHGVLDNLFDETEIERTTRRRVAYELQLLYNNSKKDFQNRVLELLNEYNEKVDEKYGKDSAEYSYYAIDLQYYLRGNIINDPGIVDAISSILSSEQPGPAVVVGSTIDNIARDFFNPNIDVQNKPEYRMNDAVFNNIIVQLNTLQNRFNDLGWVVDTNSYTWYGKFPNGVNMAGETDMIAIDQQGNIHILDFKTTSDQSKFDSRLEYKTQDLQGNEIWMPIDPENVPAGAETRISSDFLDSIATRQGGEQGKRTYASQYARQLEAYRLLIQQQTGRKVTSLEVIPFAVNYSTHEGKVLKIKEVNVYNPINLSEQQKLQEDISEIDNYLNNANQAITSEQVDNIINDTKDSIQEAVSKLENDGISGDINAKIRENIEKLKDLIDILDSIKDNNMKLADHVYVNGILDQIADVSRDLYDQLNKADELINKKANEPIVESESIDVEENKNWINEEPEEVMPDEQKRWWHFNSLHSFSQVVKGMKDYMLNNIKSDFIKNSTFVIRRDDANNLDVFSVVITYRGITFKPIQINIGKNDTCPDEMKNQQMVMHKFLGAMGRNFLRQYKLLAKTLKPGEQIVATKITRTNGTIRYSGKNKNLQDTRFMSKNDPRLLNLINGTESIVGVTDKGVVIEVGSGNREMIWSPQMDQEGNVVVKKIRDKVVPGNVGSDGIPNGVVIFLHKFKNEEDPENAPMRIVPLVLQGKNLDNYDGKLIVKILLDIMNSNTPNKTANDLYEITAKTKDGKTRKVTVPGLTNLKVIKLLARFGRQAEYAGDEFIFDYATDDSGALIAGHKIIRITDMRVEAKEDADGMLFRPTVDLDLRKQEDVNQLLDILKLTQMHINQMGTMRTNLNTDNEKSPFGALRTFFMDEENQDIQSLLLNGTTQIDIDDVFADPNDATKGLTGIAWAIKYGYAATNAEDLENPIISIHELGKESINKKKASKKIEEKQDDKINNPKQDDEKPTVNSQQNEPAPVVEPEVTVSDEDKKIEDLVRLMLEDDDDDSIMPGGGRIVELLRPEPITEEDKRKIEKKLHKLIGNVAVEWTQGAIDVLKSGPSVAGRTVVNAIKLSDRLTEGTELHEAFHRIFEILIPNGRRKKLYDVYRNKYNEQFKQANGRDLTDRDISEDFAEMFRLWMLNKQEVKLHWNLLKTFREIDQYIDSLKDLGDRRFAALFMLANSGIFRYVKPNKKNVEHFIKVLGGLADMRISAKNSNGELVKINLDKFPEFGGRSLFNDAINGIIFALCQGYSIDMLASNAARLKTSREDIANLYRGNETTKHSSWFRVLTGEYVTSDEKFTLQDANTYYRIYKLSDEIKMLSANIIKQMIKEKGSVDKKEFKVKLIATIYSQERNRTEEDLNQNQKMMNQLFNEDTWWLVEKKINNKLRKMSIDSERRIEDDYVDVMDNGPENNDEIDEESLVSKDVSDHKDEFFDHARTDDATAAIRFFLSSIPDERFATEDDVELGLVRSTQDKEGNPVTISNSTNLLGYQLYLSMKIVSNKLLLACHDVSSVDELDQKLQELANTDPIFYRIAKKYRSALRNEVLHTPDGKNKIVARDSNNKMRVVPQEMYEQYKDELGWYYVWTDAGEHPGERIEGVVTQTNPDMESFVTQLFNYVACQKLDFVMVTLLLETDADGEVVDGSYTAVVRSSDSDYAASVYPKSWFARLRSGVSGIFQISNSGKYTFAAGGKEIFYDAISTLHKIQTIFLSSGIAKLHNKDIDKNTDEGFRSIEFEFIKALNVLGIDITKEALEYYLQETFGRDVTIRQAFGRLITRKEQDTSFAKFLDAIDDLKSRVTERGENAVLTLDKDEEIVKTGSRVQKTKRSGNYIYSQNAFVKWMSRAVSRYNKVASEIMTNGPEGTKRYTLAQSHTASDITDNFNKAVLVDGEIKGSKMLRDMRKYIYNAIEGLRGIPKGSIIIKQLYFAADKRLHLVLHTHGGVKVEGNYDGGVSYNKITEREDWLAKAAILKNGGIIFPTLSDKSTWFYLTGVNVPGIDYSDISAMSSSRLLHLGLHTDQKANSTDVHVKFDFTTPNAQLDQMIEYAECERAAIEREINRGKKGTIWENLKKLPFIEFFDSNRNRFGGLSEIVVIDENGNTRLEVINDYNKTPEECLKKADELFFSKSSADKRKIMALTLEEGFMRNMAMLERAGLISATNGLKEKVLDEQGNDTGLTRDQNRLMQYKNIGLDSEAISSLRSLYMSEYKVKTNQNISLEQAQRAESQAICAYVWDMYLRGIISNEETERMYTGQPQFFKWKHSKMKNPTTGEEVDVLTDRHSDQSKRLGGLGSTGDKNRTDLANMRKTYKCAEVEDLKVASKMYKDVKSAFEDNYVRDAYIRYKEQEILNDPNISPEKRDEMLDSINDAVYGDNKKSLDEIKEDFDKNGLTQVYAVALATAEKDASAYSGDINVADGAAYITPKMAKDLLRQRGRFTSKVKEAFDILEGKKFEDGKHVNPLSNKEAFLVISEALLGAQKYSAYGYRIDESTGDIPVHYYDKFALFPIFPQIATGFTKDILRKMEKQGIDMLMMHSAVKTGSQEASECTPDMFEDAEAFERFNFKTYNQDFAFIRRQLNTDPRERESVAMGTQMTKIALTNLKKWREYTKPDGTKIRGRDLLTEIMDSINKLSNLGKLKIEKEFFTDGELDLEKFSLFLEDELERRDADANMLDGIEVIEDPKTGEQHFKVPLEAMSSVDWILSIIVSKINREVCDINVKGNALYQRSVWGMEGKPKILSDKDVNFRLNDINGGKDLKFINEEGSMDAVISIDFFEDVIPEGIKGNFNKSRQWLIDHGVIGGLANTIASRIPTQAQSSIHAIRFVDVLPVVRDTIILPKEFTKITGSDFDIDKLYLCRLSYRVSTKKVEDKLTDEVSTEYDKDKNSVDYYRNKLINDYLTLLKSHGKSNQQGIFENGDSIHISMRSIDDDTSLIKNILERIEKNRPVERSYAYKFGNIAFQVATKAAFMIGKFGIGPFALNNNSQILTQLFGVKFAKSDTHTNILDALGCLDLSNDIDKQGKMKLSWLSGLINAHVDVAKDPYIRRLNINTFTYNLTNLLIRTGMGERTLLFTAQPIMVELARVYDDASGLYMVDISKSKSSRQRSATKNFVIDSYKRGNSTNGDIKFIDEMLMDPKNSDEDNMLTEEILGSFALAIFGIDSDGKYLTTFEYIDPMTGDVVEKGKKEDEPHCILEDVLTNPEALISTKKGFTFDNIQGNRPLYRVTVKNRNGAMELIDMSPRDVELYVYFIQNALAKYGQKMSDLVNACKIDTKKQGKSFVEQEAYLSKYDDVFNNEDGLFEDKGILNLKNNSYVDVKTKNATDLYRRILSTFSIQSTATFVDAHNRVMTKLNSSAQNKALSKKVTAAIMTWLKSKFFQQYIEEKGDEYFQDLFYGKNSILNRLIKIQNEIKRDTTGKFFKFGEDKNISLGGNGVITNPLLKALQPDIYEQVKGFQHPQFIKLENALLDDSDNMNALERAWDELYRDTTHYYDDESGRHYYIKEFAEDLAIYAFLTSGDKNGTTKFFKCVPNTIRTAISATINGQKVSYAKYIENLQEMFTNGEYDFSDQDINEIIGNNWQDNDFVKQIKLNIRRGKKRIICHTVFGTVTTKSDQTVAYKKKGGKVGFRKEQLVKSVSLYIAGVKKTEKGLKQTIYRCNDDKFPPYIKVRRPSSTKYDADNYLLYKLIDQRAIDPTDPNSDVYPIYEISSPQVVNLRAGSYDYMMINFDLNSPAYPLDMQNVVRTLDENALTTEENANKSLEEFVIALNNMGVYISDDTLLEQLLMEEFDTRGFEYDDTLLKKALEYIKRNMKPSDEGGKSGKKGKKKTIKRIVEDSGKKKEEKKVEVKKQEETPEQVKFSVEDLFDDNEEVELKNKPVESAPEKKKEDKPQQSLSEDDLDDDDMFDGLIEGICTGLIKPGE